MLKRQAIVAEIQSRLETYFSSLEVDVKKGAITTSEQDYPAVFIYEDTEEIVPLQKGNTHCKLPIQLDYYFRMYENSYTEGNEAFLNIKKAVETDEYFNNMCISYDLILRDIDIRLEPITKVSVVYEFNYYEFKGESGTLT